jgi:tripartite-type tricarboxylate transporter receptor subunit TctC
MSAKAIREQGMSRPSRFWIATIALVLSSAGGFAQTSYPNRTITIVVPTPPGGTLDVITRLASIKLQSILGQPVVLEYKPGAGLNIGAAHVARAAPDGYTLLTAPQLTYNADLLSSNLLYHPQTLEPVTVMVGYPNVVVARPGLPLNSFAELLAYARAHPDALTYASQGNGQISHLTFEMLNLMANLKLRHVPYRGSAPAITAILADQIDLLADNQFSTDAHIAAGKMKLLAVTGTKRLPAYPNVPTVAEVVPGFVSDTWLAIGAPPGTPKEIRRKLAGAFAEALRMPDVKARLDEAHADIVASTPEQMAEIVHESRARWEPVVKAANIHIE